MKKHIAAIIPLGLYTFFYLVLELAINDYAEPVIGGAKVPVLYGFSYFTVAAGYPLYHFTARLKTSARRLLMPVAGGLCAVAFLVLSYTSSMQVFITCTLVSHLTSGFIGGAVYLRSAMLWRGSARVGLYTGIAYTGANAVQAVGLVLLSLLSIPAGRMVERVALMVVLFALVLLTSAKEEYASAPVDETPPAIRKFILGALAAMAIIACLQGVNDGIITSMHAGGEYIAYSYPRLFVLPGLLVAGLVADMNGRRVFPYATFLSMIIMTAGILFFSTPETYSVAISFIYFFGSFMSLFSAVPFMVWAPSTARPALASVAGRSVRYAFSGLAILVGGALYATSSLVQLLVIYVLLLAGLFSLFFFMGQLNKGGGQKQDALKTFAQSYSLTEREAEILALLYMDNTTEAIAGALFISEKTVRNHISNMLSKTGLHSRNELLSLVKQAYTEQEVGGF